MKKVFKSLAAAFQFLTILPLPVKTNEGDLKNSLFWFPAIGAFIGAVCGYSYQGLNELIGEQLGGVLTILLYIILTRGLHLDGFMDTIDGFFSRKPKQDIIRIMREPQVGSFAVLGTGIWFLVLFTSVGSLSISTWILIPLLARTNILLFPLLFSYGSHQGTGKFFFAAPNRILLSSALVIPVMVTVMVDLSHYKLVLFAYTTALLIGWWSTRKIGGITGDVLGFIIEVSQVLLILMVAIGV